LIMTALATVETDDINHARASMISMVL